MKKLIIKDVLKFTLLSNSIIALILFFVFSKLTIENIFLLFLCLFFSVVLNMSIFVIFLLPKVLRYFNNIEVINSFFKDVFDKEYKDIFCFDYFEMKAFLDWLRDKIKSHEDCEKSKELSNQSKEIFYSLANTIKNMADENNEKDISKMANSLVSLLELNADAPRIFNKVTYETSIFESILISYKVTLKDLVDIIVLVDDDVKDAMVLHGIFYPIARFFADNINNKHPIKKIIKISASKFKDTLNIIVYSNINLQKLNANNFILDNLNNRIKLYTSVNYGLKYEYYNNSCKIEINFPLIYDKY